LNPLSLFRREKQISSYYSDNCFGSFGDSHSKELLTIWAYHGTSSKRATSILETGFAFSAETDCVNRLQWLGTGVYFFENDKLSAMDWAKYRAETDDLCKPVVFAAVLACEQSNFFDFNDRKQFSLYKRYYDAVKEDAIQHVEDGDKIDGLVLELLCKELDVAMMRACLNTLDSLPLQSAGEWSRLVDGMQVQICVRDDQCIKSLIDSQELSSHALIC